MSELGVDVAAMKSAAPAFEAVAADLDEARSALETAAGAEEGCWGADQFGTAFSDAYVPGASSAVGGMTLIAGALRELTAALIEITDRFEAIDTSLADDLAGGL
ncbi:hypothetical protein [Rhodococcus baikonurensis]|uniref:WXG100 family type VII secretion target n=1 Tax=Rhodococcus baikonurensis TaxID=172041 RepID=A0ABV5XEF4_9NOCA